MTRENQNDGDLGQLIGCHNELMTRIRASISWLDASVGRAFRSASDNSGRGHSWSPMSTSIVSVEYPSELACIAATIGHAFVDFNIAAALDSRSSDVQTAGWAANQPPYVGEPFEGAVLHHQISQSLGKWQRAASAQGLRCEPGFGDYCQAVAAAGAAAVSTLRASFRAVSETDWAQRFGDGQPLPRKNEDLY